MARRGARVVRGTLGASLATFTALLSHVAGGGAMPGWLGILAPLVLSTMVCTLLAGRRLSVIRLSAAVAVSQILFHTLFVLGAGPTVGPVMSGHHHAHAAMPMAALPTTATSAALHADTTMWAWHAAAAVLTIAALHHGERVTGKLRELAVAAARWIRGRVAVPQLARIAAAPRIRPSREREHRPADVYLSTLRRRGPPALLVL